MFTMRGATGYLTTNFGGYDLTTRLGGFIEFSIFEVTSLNFYGCSSTSSNTSTESEKPLLHEFIAPIMICTS